MILGLIFIWCIALKDLPTHIKFPKNLPPSINQKCIAPCPIPALLHTRCNALLDVRLNMFSSMMIVIWFIPKCNAPVTLILFSSIKRLGILWQVHYVLQIRCNPIIFLIVIAITKVFSDRNAHLTHQYASSK